MSSRNAFTLIELLVVISIILVLMGLLMGGVMAVRSHAARVKAQSQVAQLAAAIENYRSTNAIYPERLVLAAGMPSFQNTTFPGEAYQQLFDAGGNVAKTVDQFSDSDWLGINQVLVYQLGNLASEMDPQHTGQILDQWGKPLRYRPAKWYPFKSTGSPQMVDSDKPPGQDTYQLWSIGPDKIDGYGATGDDLPNWQKN